MPIDIGLGGSNQVLQTNDTGTAVEWETLDFSNILGQDLIAVDGSITVNSGGIGATLINTDISVAPDGITNDKIADNAINTENILDGQVQTNDIAPGSNNQFLRTNNLGVVEWASFLGLISASEVTYDPSSSGLLSTDLQAAIDEINTATGTVNLTDNGDGTYTFTKADGSTVTIMDTSISTLTDNADGTFTYTDETGTPVTFDAKMTTATDNADGTFDITDDSGNNITIDTNQTTSTLVDNTDGTFTYTDETGTPVTFDAKITTAIDNTDGTFDITDDSGNNITIDTNQTTSTLVDNADDTFTYTDETGTPVTFDAKITTAIDNADGTFDITDDSGNNITIDTNHPGTIGSIFFSDGAGGLSENNGQLFWDATNNKLGIGTNTPDVKLRVNGQVKASSLVSNPNGLETNPSFRFENDPNSGMFLASVGELAFTANGVEAFRIISNQNVGIGTTTPTSTLHTGGSFATNIRSDPAATVTILDNDYTIIVTTATDIDIPSADATNLGRIYIIKNITGIPITMTGDNYINSSGTTQNTIVAGITKLQSDGADWQQIN